MLALARGRTSQQAASTWPPSGPKRWARSLTGRAERSGGAGLGRAWIGYDSVSPEARVSWTVGVWSCCRLK
jgi:hypothetical protein